jgi:DNA-binding IclR family transcriptional regulator
LITTLKRAREVGYLVTGNIVIKGVSAVALPFAGHSGLPLAAITVAAVSSRLPPSRQRELAGIMRSEIQKTERLLRDPNALSRRVA